MFWLTILWGFLASIASRAVTTFGLENIFVVKNIDFLANYSSPWKGDDHSTKVSSVRKIKDALHRTKLLKIDPDRQMIRDQRDRWCRPPSAVCVVSYLMLVFEPHPEGSQAASSSTKVFRAWVILFVIDCSGEMSKITSSGSRSRWRQRKTVRISSGLGEASSRLRNCNLEATWIFRADWLSVVIKGKMQFLVWLLAPRTVVRRPSSLR